jgi:hypothetical protein
MPPMYALLQRGLFYYMAKGFHYFKFIATEWLTGDICFEDYELQGIFINVCAIYWQRNGDVSFEDLQKRLKTDRLNLLCDRFISVNEGKISIEFLDEQLIDAGHISKVNSENGAKGGRPKGALNKEKKPTAKRPLSESKAKKTQIELELELKIELELNKNKFLESLYDFKQTYSSEMIKQFFDYWTELNTSKTKMRFQSEKFFDTSKRLATWSRNQKQTFNKSEIKPQININTI